MTSKTLRPATDRLVEVEPAEWDSLLDRLGCADVYLTRAYVEAACLLDPGTPAYLRHAEPGGEVVFCCIVREIEARDGGPAARDVTTPYGYGGPVAVGERAPVARFYELYERWCRENGVVSSFIRFHPLFANHSYAGEGIRLQPLSGTIGWQLEASRDLFRGMHRHHQRVIRKARGAGLSVSVREAPTELDAFARLYRGTMERRQARAFYFFPASYWKALTGPLRDRVVRFDAYAAEELVASCLCFASQPWLHYHLGATLEAARSLGASNLLMYEAACWAQARGFTVFHLGGGLGGRNDSLHAFKRRFDPEGERESWLGKAVHDRERYLALAQSEALSFDGFFPAYRQPVA